MERKKPRKKYSWLQTDSHENDINPGTKYSEESVEKDETEKKPVTDLNPGLSYMLHSSLVIVLV